MDFDTVQVAPWVCALSSCSLHSGPRCLEDETSAAEGNVGIAPVAGTARDPVLVRPPAFPSLPGCEERRDGCR